MTTFDATKLREALLNVAPHTERDGLTQLGAVRMESDGQTVQLIATDRYVLATETVDAVEAGEAFTFQLAADDVVKLASMCKGAPRNVTYWPVTLTVADDRLTASLYEVTATFTTVGGDFPRWRSIFTGAQESALDPANSVEHVAYNPQLLAKFAKVTTGGRKSNLIRLHFTSPTKPAYVEIGETFRAVLMPCRVDWFAPIQTVAVAS